MEQVLGYKMNAWLYGKLTELVHFKRHKLRFQPIMRVLERWPSIEFYIAYEGKVLGYGVRKNHWGETACAIALEAYTADDSQGVIDAIIIPPLRYY